MAHSQQDASISAIVLHACLLEQPRIHLQCRLLVSELAAKFLLLGDDVLCDEILRKAGSNGGKRNIALLIAGGCGRIPKRLKTLKASETVRKVPDEGGTEWAKPSAETESRQESLRCNVPDLPSNDPGRRGAAYHHALSQ
eukprot:6204093-Pleurochrysis_carterae.AAC.1